MLKVFILITALSFNFAFAKARFSDAEKQKFMDETKQEIADYKIDNKGVIDLQVIKPMLYEKLDAYYKQQKFTNEEMVQIKQKYEDLSKKDIKPELAEEELFKFIQNNLGELNKTPVVKIKEGQICNHWGCEEGLKCAYDPKQVDGKSCKKEGTQCKDDGDCCSSTCSLDKKTKKKICDEVFRCFKPLTLGQSCMSNPVCGEGVCLEYNSNTSGIGECSQRGKSCKKNSECCSNSCENNKCTESFICKSCVNSNAKPSRGQKCCEGLYLNEAGKCVPDVAPFVPTEVNIKSKTLELVASFFLSSAHAEEMTEEEKKAEAARIANSIAAKVGAASSSASDIGKALEKYEESKDDIAQIKKLATLDPRYQGIYDQALNQEAEEDAKEAARTKQAALDSSDMSAQVRANSNSINSGTYVQKIKQDPKKIIPPIINLTRASDFKTCDIRFRDDYIKYLKEAKLLDLEMAFLSFDFMFLGEGVNDYWTKSANPDTSIYARLKSIANKHQLIRKSTNDKIDVINTKLTCLCLDVKGYKNIQDDTKKKFFEKCDEYKKYLDPATTFDDLEGDASGLKALRLASEYTNQLSLFTMDLTVDNSDASKSLGELSSWMSTDAKWDQVENRSYSLFNFNIKNPSNSVLALGAVLGALLAAGVIAVLGGFASTSILTTWAAAGIIATSAVTGGTGLWLIASLKGAWISQHPEIIDKTVRTYSCGKKESCTEYSRVLNQPFNNICNVHTSANACVKNFLVFYENGEPNYVVDPWIPKGVSKSLVLRDLSDARNYAEKMEDAFQSAKANMVSKNPGATGGDSKSGGSFVTDAYLENIFIDAGVLGYYTPKIGLDDQRYLINEKIILEIKNAAKAYAVAEKLFQAEDTENLNHFADYVYEYHFLWPKTSRAKEISYPTLALTTYVDLMENGVAAEISAQSGKATNTLVDLHKKYVDAYLRTLDSYLTSLPINQDGTVKGALLNAEILKVQNELDNATMFSALANNKALDSQLLNFGPGANSVKGINGLGLSATDATLTAGQAKYLNAIGKLRIARKTQLKKLDTYKKAMAANGNSDRAAKVASASNNLRLSFSNPSSKYASGKSLFGSGGLDGLKSGTDDKNKSDSSSKDKDGKSSSGNGGYGTGDGSGGSGGASSSHSGSGGVGISAADKDKANGANANDAANAGANSEEARRLAEAIEARNKANKDKYKSREDQTLFEKITNAYIRNYDKVLIRKKDKDIIEQK